MRKISFDELFEEANQEKIINIPDVEVVIEQLLQDDEIDEEFDYSGSSRKKLRKIVSLFNEQEFLLYGTAEEIHNCAVPLARVNMYDCACIILKRGLKSLEGSVDLLADYIRYGISCGRYEECEEYFLRLKGISKNQWNWRAFSFSIDYLLDKVNRTNGIRERNNIKKTANRLADEFISIIGKDQAYFDKAQVIRTFGGDNENTEETILLQGIHSLKVAPRCALRMSDILFERGEYKEAVELLKKCCINAFSPQPDISGSYSFLLSALSKTSELFSEYIDSDFSDKENVVMDIYKDFNTALEANLNNTYKQTANTAIKIIEAQTKYDYPYNNIEDQYDF